MWRHLLFLAVGPFFVVFVRAVHAGPQYPPTKGEVWPRPFHQIKTETYYTLESPKAFTVKILNHTCDILDKAVHRLLHLGLATKFTYVRKREYKRELIHHNDVLHAGTFAHNQTEFRIKLLEKCEKYPYLEMDEGYNLTVGEKIVLKSDTIWGILRGLQSFYHLLYFSDDYSEIRINATRIMDSPAYAHRGLLVDTGRHYIKPSALKSLIDAMEVNKLNVLHWHMVDDESFPYQSEKFPELSKKGAYHSSMVYTKDEIQNLVGHARLAGIRVIPEFDVPDHVRSWGEAYPEILTECYKKNKTVGLGPLDPTRNETYTFLQQLYQEVSELFPDAYMHLGGDEVNLKCWNSNPRIQDYMKKNKITLRNLYSLFMEKVQSILPPQTKSLMWQDVFDECEPFPDKTSLVQVWSDGWVDSMLMILGTGRKAVFSASWYLDKLNRGWETFYSVDPRTIVFNTSAIEEYLQNIVGGEACMWGEMVDGTNGASRTWPRASAVAERLWVGADYTNPSAVHATDETRRRVEEHACRMIQLGIAAEPPNGPGFCVGPRHSEPPMWVKTYLNESALHTY